VSQKYWQLCILGPSGTHFVEVRGLMAVGGDQSTGVTVSGLKYKDDYLILSPTPQGVSIHCLKGKKNQSTVQLETREHFQLLDLTLLLLPATESATDADESKSVDRFADDIKVLVQKFSQPGDLKGSMDLLLETMISAFEMDKGLVIASNPQGEFKMLAQENIRQDEPWLSETLVQQTITSQRPTIVQNIIGSRFERSKSLMGTGFMSVCVWPLCLRGEVLGVLMIGSDRPHSGLNSSQTLAAEAYVQLAALMLKFYLNDITLKKEVEMLKNSRAHKDSPLTTVDDTLRESLKLAEQLADTELSLLVQGETGVGKEVMTRWIHDMSSRKDKPFVAVNCGAIPGELLESLLFGHRKGAFTGAVKDQKGKFLQADGGTLFLDEIGDLSGHLQVKILRALQEKAIEPLGSEKSLEVDVRILCATHKDLKTLVEKGEFRQDLYYRLAEVTFEIPPLRKRREDISLIAHEVLSAKDSEKRFSADAINWLQAQEWPGNVRELLSAVKRAMALCTTDVIQVQHLTLGGPQDKAHSELSWLGGENLEEAKNNFVMDKVKLALKKSNNKRAQAAELLGVTPRTLFRYLENMEP
jgi:two-component system response regulator PilR (NtrC family)